MDSYDLRLKKRAERKNAKAKRLIRKIQKELAKPISDLRKVLRWQEKTAKLLEQKFKLLKKIDERLAYLSEDTIHFNMEKISEKHVKKFGASACVFRATMERPRDDKVYKIKDIVNELNELFANTIHQVKKACDLVTPLEDRMRIMICSNELKSPISTQLLPAIRMTSNRAIADKNPKIKQFKQGKAIQKREALKLFKKANISYGPCGIRELSEFQGVLLDYQIQVIDFNARNTVIFEGPPKHKKLILYKQGDHYNAINLAKLPAFHGERFYCDKCFQFLKNGLNHPCFNVCITCRQKDCVEISDEKHMCSDCFKICRSTACFNRHKKSRRSKGVDLPSMCDKSFRCQMCSSIVDKDRQNEHCCGETVCHICNKFVLDDHLCFMQTENPKLKNDSLIFYDFETDFSTGEHVVNFAVAQYLDENIKVLQQLPIMAFDGAFDGVFIQRWLIEYRPTADIHLINSGQKIMQLTVKDHQIRLIDSLNFLQMPLAKFPKTFGLDETKFSKGDFPLLFNTKENQNYVGPIPDIKYYSPDSKFEKDRTKLIAWHEERTKNNFVFDFQKEMAKYCSQDVIILRLCCLQFRDLFLAETKVDPFCYCTIAAAVMAIYRSKYLQPNTIGIVPKNMYRNSNKPFSQSAIVWLEFVSAQTNCKIQHALNGGEKKVEDPELGKVYYVDGFCEETNTIFSFYGCLYHACPSCYDLRNDHPFFNEKQMADVFDETIRRQNRLLQLGYEVKTIWEHDYCKLKETDEMKHFLDTNDIVTNLEPRDAFFGGRVNGFKLFRDAQQDETIEYVDFTSLYRYVNKTKVYPVGHPAIIRENFETISNYFGLIKCKVLAPRNLYLPISPARIKDKLFFPLCKQCVVQNSSVCTHSENERAFWGTFTTVEVLKAIEKGYKVIEIFEIWHFENTSSDLFSDYVNYFLRIKQESSGFPSRIQTPENRQKYVADYYENEGMLLRHDKIDYNPGLRALAKLCLNSLWGKFCQKDNLLNTEFINDPLHFYRRLNGADIEMHDLCILNDD
ncbi:uncharacterized protein LOC124455682 [Xenia sp. Carnegie-2017]|uniref:uncharacterized protein LOC124455682 n=1 Tax=Xenia sp. Carnegie-2017 TaxID=2897299 RepID=UPI001F040CD5|nr:uncharacterized protein LOC124455682 [Xenia sp. Carnegie-2017]